ncbi:pectate lyase [Novipirellula artificiosorum]|uniref:Pectic acid lyase n=1 Tax=Novipirellula artificiosorum TaxID=2528016 RepID=A0A5C6DZ96_9BACT|nr:pectate lyase [Novipirellula artificiosorum]TWU41948.1 Pectic acid lyase [Novipirellula artificiosorum]
MLKPYDEVNHPPVPKLGHADRPLYLDRDSEFRYDYNAISYERRSGHTYHGTWAESVLEKDYPRWRDKNRGSTP